MKKLIIGIISLLYTTTSVADSNCKEFYYNGVRPISAYETTEFCMDKFVIEFLPSRKTPLWSAQVITKETVIQNRAIPRINNFHSEVVLPKILQAKNKDYEGTGYDRGHLTAFKDQAASIDINSLINIIPQAPKLNRIQWENLESKLRNEAINYRKLYIITGVILKGDKKIGNGIPVPSQIYKIVYYPNMEKAYLTDNIDSAVIVETTISHIEALSGATFPKLH